MPGKARADRQVVTVPKKNFVQQQAEDYGFKRVMVDGEPMLLKAAEPEKPFEDYTPKRRAKVIGPVLTGSTRG